MSAAVDAADNLRCSVCQVRSAILERIRQTEVLQAQAVVAVAIINRHKEKALTEEARKICDDISADIMRNLGAGGI